MELKLQRSGKRCLLQLMPGRLWIVVGGVCAVNLLEIATYPALALAQGSVPSAIPPSLAPAQVVPNAQLQGEVPIKRVEMQWLMNVASDGKSVSIISLPIPRGAMPDVALAHKYVREPMAQLAALAFPRRNGVDMPSSVAPQSVRSFALTPLPAAPTLIPDAVSEPMVDTTRPLMQMLKH